MNRKALITAIAATVIAAGAGITISYAADTAAPTPIEQLDAQLTEIAHQSRLADQTVCAAGAAGFSAQTIADLLAARMMLDKASIVRPAVDRTLANCRAV